MSAVWWGRSYHGILQSRYAPTANLKSRAHRHGVFRRPRWLHRGALSLKLFRRRDEYCLVKMTTVKNGAGETSEAPSRSRALTRCGPRRSLRSLLRSLRRQRPRPLGPFQSHPWRVQPAIARGGFGRQSPVACSAAIARSEVGWHPRVTVSPPATFSPPATPEFRGRCGDSSALRPRRPPGSRRRRAARGRHVSPTPPPAG